ncbi:MarR family EPS-associated transcriptional regulator [Thermodesulfobacteriota bacterium]
MKLTEKTFQVMEALDDKEVLSQRHLARRSGVSLSQVNYVLKSLLEKGLVKIKNFRKSQNKIGYVYLLTPKGIEAKSRVAVDFVVSKLEELDRLRQKVVEKLTIIEQDDHSQIVFVGPEIVKDFVDSIIKENALELYLVGFCSHWEELKEYKPDSFDIALLFDGDAKNMSAITEITGIHQEKLLSLW